MKIYWRLANTNTPLLRMSVLYLNTRLWIRINQFCSTIIWKMQRSKKSRAGKLHCLAWCQMWSGGDFHLTQFRKQSWVIIQQKDMFPSDVSLLVLLCVYSILISKFPSDIRVVRPVWLEHLCSWSICSFVCRDLGCYHTGCLKKQKRLLF